MKRILIILLTPLYASQSWAALSCNKVFEILETSSSRSLVLSLARPHLPDRELKKPRIKYQSVFLTEGRAFYFITYVIKTKTPTHRLTARREQLTNTGGVFILVNLSTKQVIWALETMVDHNPSDFILDHTNPNAGLIAKRVTSISETPNSSSRESFLEGYYENTLFEILYVGHYRVVDLYTGNQSIKFLGTENNNLSFVTKNGDIHSLPYK